MMRRAEAAALSRWAARLGRPRVGFVRFGSLRRTTPISPVWGWDRGLPIDRYYIEDFLRQAASRGEIRGRVLEFHDDAYARRFGGQSVTATDVLNIEGDVSGTTIMADLASADDIPSDAFDCIICTQVLHLIYEVRPAVETLRRILRAGGVLLATVPCVSKITREWDDHWRFTSRSASRFFREIFGDAVDVQAYGNVLAAIAFLEGLSAHELKEKELGAFDPDFEVIVGIRARKDPGSARNT
jgi:SAM-dependent methyltransferase